jgi:hypothetical protein
MASTTTTLRFTTGLNFLLSLLLTLQYEHISEVQCQSKHANEIGRNFFIMILIQYQPHEKVLKK